MAFCSSCRAEIIWVKSSLSGKMIPCDPIVLSVVTDQGQTVRGRINHFITCPSAEQHRQKVKETER